MNNGNFVHNLPDDADLARIENGLAATQPHYGAQSTGRVIVCSQCDGNGSIVIGWDEDAYENVEGECPMCDGTGKLEEVARPLADELTALATLPTGEQPDELNAEDADWVISGLESEVATAWHKVEELEAANADLQAALTQVTRERDDLRETNVTLVGQLSYMRLRSKLWKQNAKIRRFQAKTLLRRVNDFVQPAPW